MTYIKKYLHHLFVDGMNGMAVGLFATFVWGTVLQQIGFYTSGYISTLIYNLGELLCSLTCAGIGIGIAHQFHEGLWVSICSAVCGMAGGYASQVISGAILSGGSIVLSTPGEPLGAFAAAYVGIEIGHILAGKTKYDFILAPLLTLGSGVAAGLLAGPYISMFTSWFGSLISWGTQQSPFFMGILVSVLMGMASTLPIHAITLAFSLHLSGLAAGAAAVGCCCNMIGFAVASYQENKVSGLIAQGIGTSTLQMANILKKPIIWLPVILSSAILGPVSTMLFKMTNSAAGAGLGTLGFSCSISAWQYMSQTQSVVLVLIKIFLMHFLLPGIFTLFFSEWMRKQKWIKFGDMKLDMQ